MRRNESHVVRKVMSMNVDGYSGRGRPKKRWMDCVKADMVRKNVTCEMTADRRIRWNEKTCCVDPKQNWDKGRRMMRIDLITIY
ncbi:hypothetical protein B5X24_HaOG209587 [Helicoverpa armigera]|nr:hypothetical protein B5X24_HaOG209587 [Helicoverpa armigera]